MGIRQRTPCPPFTQQLTGHTSLCWPRAHLVPGTLQEALGDPLKGVQNRQARDHQFVGVSPPGDVQWLHRY